MRVQIVTLATTNIHPDVSRSGQFVHGLSDIYERILWPTREIGSFKDSVKVLMEFTIIEEQTIKRRYSCASCQQPINWVKKEE